MATNQSSSPPEPDQQPAQATPVPYWELYNQHAQQAWTDQQASSDEFDKALLTFSSGALVLSLAFIKDIVPLKEAVSLHLLYSSWGLFLACIVVTVLSFALSIEAQKVHVTYLYRYYIERKDEYGNKRSTWSKLVTLCAYLGGTFFLAGLATTVLFAYLNISGIK